MSPTVKRSLFAASFMLLADPVLADTSTLDTVVVTARRGDSKQSDSPQNVQIISEKTIEQSVALDVTDALKKLAVVDVVQYPGLLSGIGMRGFRPETSGINKHTLLLVDGMPAGATNLAAIPVENIERIEILKGAGSALYGASAMGGVVNVITKHSTGTVKSALNAGYGSFNTYDMGINSGGSIQPSLDFDANIQRHDQQGDYRMGGEFNKVGKQRADTAYSADNASGRLGVDINNNWRLDGNVELFQADDVAVPGSVFFGNTDQSSKDLSHHNLRGKLLGIQASHTLSLAAYNSSENSDVTPKTSPWGMYDSYREKNTWTGLQAKDAWCWTAGQTLTYGLDAEHVSSDSWRKNRAGQPLTPYQPNSERRTLGIYFQNESFFNADKTVLTLGARHDRIEVETLATAHMSGFTPATAAFTTVNPSIGISHKILPELRAHSSAGTAFMAPNAIQMAGESTMISYDKRTVITRGNPNLDPENSFTWDGGLEWSGEKWRTDATYFNTQVRDMIISNVLVANPPAPAPIIYSYENANTGRMHGLELEGQCKISETYGLSASATRLFSRQEDLKSGGQRDIQNVPSFTLVAGLTADFGALDGRVNARYVSGRKDTDWDQPTRPVIEYDNLTVVDAVAGYQLDTHQRVSLEVGNLFNREYYEKLGFPLAGRTLTARYRYAF